MIQIDDAGWGSLLMGVIIAGYRRETGDFAWKEIPVEMFQGENFLREAYRQGAVDAVKGVLLQLRHKPEEPIEICTGYVLDGIRNYLSEQGLHWSAAKITGHLQDKIERLLLDNLRVIGLKDLDYETLTEKHGLFFWNALRWLKGGGINGKALPERERVAKTGWPTYHIWASMPYNEAKKAAKNLKAARRSAKWRASF